MLYNIQLQGILNARKTRKGSKCINAIGGVIGQNQLRERRKELKSEWVKRKKKEKITSRRL